LTVAERRWISLSRALADATDVPSFESLTRRARRRARRRTIVEVGSAAGIVLVVIGVVLALVVLQRRQEAWFDVGTATAYQGGAHTATITRLETRPVRQQGWLDLEVRLGASAPQGHRVPVRETALHRPR
jgi:hypothetical protein